MRSGYEEKLKEKTFLHVLAANPLNLMKKEQKQNKLEPFTDNHLSECSLGARSRIFFFVPKLNDSEKKNPQAPRGKVNVNQGRKFFFIFWEMDVSTWWWVGN